MYDAAIIGAGANGLTAAAVLTRAGRSVIVLDRAGACGGRLATDPFHPGFSASAFADRVPEIPPAVMMLLRPGAPLNVTPLPDDIRARRDGALAQIFAQARLPHRHRLRDRVRRAFAPVPPVLGWPGQDLATRSLMDWPLADRAGLCGAALAGRSLDPHLAGSALTLLALHNGEPPRGGLGALAQDFLAAAGDAVIRLGLEASEVSLMPRRPGGLAVCRASGVILADGSRIAARAVISTLDLKRSTLSLFPWAALPPGMPQAAAAWRMGGGAARLLLALNRPTALTQPLLLDGDRDARAAFRRGALPARPPLLVDPVCARDASLAPQGCATLTVTLSGIPALLFDGGWTQAHRQRLAASALTRIEAALPGTLAALAGIRILAPPDIEHQLGATGGDLDGGQLSPDQMLGLRPDVRTPLAGFYLGGGSTAAGPLGLGAAGFAAATALLADQP